MSRRPAAAVVIGPSQLRQLAWQLASHGASGAVESAVAGWLLGLDSRLFRPFAAELAAARGAVADFAPAPAKQKESSP